MADKSQIEWTEATWNPVTGCSKISAGCKNCYAERLAMRLKAMGNARYRNGFAVTLHEDVLELPKRWKQPRMIFVNSMSDLFHKEVPLSFIQSIFKTMQECPQHTFQILTKRSERLKSLADRLDWPSNVWMGVTVEDGTVIHRIADLQQVPAAIRFLSCEPLIGDIGEMPLDGIDWVIVGGESGPYARPVKVEWIRSIFRQCRKEKIPFFFKQWGGPRKDLTGRELNGRVYDEMPKVKSRFTHQEEMAIA